MVKFLSLALAFSLISGSVHADEPRYDSWQIRHPVVTAAVAGLTFDMVPATFGDDLKEVDGYVERGWTKATLMLLMPHAKKAHKNAKRIIWILELLIVFFLAIRIARKRN